MHLGSIKLLKTAVLVFYCGTAFCAAASSDADYRIENPVVTFDLWKCFQKERITESRERANITYLVTTLQGVVNRERPRLFLFASLQLFDRESRWRYLPPDPSRRMGNLDRFWFQQLLGKGYFKQTQVQDIDSLDELIAHFRSEIKGWSLWTSEVPATLNVAMMAAGVERLLPTSPDLDGGKLCERLKSAFPDIKSGLDVTRAFTGKGTVSLGGISFPSTGSAKNDAYQYAIRAWQSGGKLDPGFFWYNCDASLWGPLHRYYDKAGYDQYGDGVEFQHGGLFNADYWVSKRAFIFDLSPWTDEAPADDPGQKLGTDWTTWNDILENSYRQRDGRFGVCGGFIPWWIKYTSHTGGKHEPVPGEWRFVALLTSYNLLNDGDAAFGFANASFYQHLPKLSAQECVVTYPPPQKLQGGVSYLCIFMMDYDGSAWLNQMVPSIYDDPARGRYPLNWAVNPILNERVPQAVRYLYEHRTTQDFLGIEDDGVGYISPAMLLPGRRLGRIQEDGTSFYQSFAQATHQRFGIQYTAFYICDILDKKWQEMAARLTPKGFGCNFPGPKRINNTPIIHLRDYHISEYPRLRKEMEAVFANASVPQSPTLLQACRCILYTPTQIAQAFDELKAAYPNAKVKIVDAATFFDLQSQFNALQSPPEPGL